MINYLQYHLMGWGRRLYTDAYVFRDEFPPDTFAARAVKPCQQNWSMDRLTSYAYHERHLPC